ncbi:MAG: response regulator, partial [Bacteroidetes bacterium]
MMAQPALDSLFAVWQDPSQPDSTRADAFRQYVWDGFLFSNPDSALSLADTLQAFAALQSDPDIASTANNLARIALYLLGEYDGALTHFERCLAHNQAMGKQSSVANLLYNIGIIHQDQRRFAQALQVYQQSLRTRQTLGDSSYLAKNYSNTGMGIPEDQQEQVFDRFFQAKETVTPASPGTGIGLALARELVELHQGEISLSSKPGEGSAFWVRLPLSLVAGREPVRPYHPRLEPVGEAVSGPAPVASLEQAEQGRILIMEDNPDLRSYLRQEIARLGYEVNLAMARSEQPDLILSDVMMPKMDGFELAQAIRADANCSHIPLILLTAKASNESRITILETGVDAYLTKPFNARELEVRIAKLIEPRLLLRQKFAEALTIRPEEVSAVPMDQKFLR